MKRWYPGADAHLALRVLWLYGLYTLVSNAAFLVGYYLLPEGLFRSGPLTASGRAVAGVTIFWGQLLLTLAFNVAVVVSVAVVMNVNRVPGGPDGPPPAGHGEPPCSSRLRGSIPAGPIPLRAPPACGPPPDPPSGPPWAPPTLG